MKLTINWNFFNFIEAERRLLECEDASVDSTARLTQRGRQLAAGFHCSPQHLRSSPESFITFNFNFMTSTPQMLTVTDSA